MGMKLYRNINNDKLNRAFEIRLLMLDIRTSCLSPPQNRTSDSAGSGIERSPRGGEQPSSGQRGQGCSPTEEPQHPGDGDHL